MKIYPYNYNFHSKFIDIHILYTKNYITSYRITYKKKPIYIQTPKLEVIKTIHADHKNGVILCTLPFNTKIYEFNKMIYNLHECCKINNKTKPVFNDQYLYGDLKKINDTALYTIYNSNKIECDIDKILPSYQSLNIIHLNNIWIKRNRLHIHWNIVQMKYYIPIYFKKCIIDDIDEINNQLIEKTQQNTSSQITFESHPIYSKFFKMLKMGIPKMSVQQKCSLENINISCLDYLPTDLVPDTFNTITKPKMITPGDLTNISLKKTIIPKKKKIKHKHMGFIPDIDELLKIKNSLHKITIHYE